MDTLMYGKNVWELWVYLNVTSVNEYKNYSALKSYFYRTTRNMNRLPRSYRSGCQSPIQWMFILIALSGGDHLKCASSKRVNPYSPKRYSPCPLGILLFAFAALTVSSIRSRHPNRTEPSQAGFVGGEQRRPQSSLYDSFSHPPHPFPIPAWCAQVRQPHSSLGSNWITKLVCPFCCAWHRPRCFHIVIIMWAAAFA